MHKYKNRTRYLLHTTQHIMPLCRVLRAWNQWWQPLILHCINRWFCPQIHLHAWNCVAHTCHKSLLDSFIWSKINPRQQVQVHDTHQGQSSIARERKRAHAPHLMRMCFTHGKNTNAVIEGGGRGRLAGWDVVLPCQGLVTGLCSIYTQPTSQRPVEKHGVGICQGIITAKLGLAYTYTRSRQSTRLWPLENLSKGKLHTMKIEKRTDW